MVDAVMVGNWDLNGSLRVETLSLFGAEKRKGIEGSENVESRASI